MYWIECPPKWMHSMGAELLVSIKFGAVIIQITLTLLLLITCSCVYFFFFLFVSHSFCCFSFIFMVEFCRTFSTVELKQINKYYSIRSVCVYFIYSLNFDHFKLRIRDDDLALLPKTKLKLAFLMMNKFYEIFKP